MSPWIPSSYVADISLSAQSYPVIEQAALLACAVSSTGLEVAAVQLGIRGLLSPYLM